MRPSAPAHFAPTNPIPIGRYPGPYNFRPHDFFRRALESEMSARTRSILSNSLLLRPAAFRHDVVVGRPDSDFVDGKGARRIDADLGYSPQIEV